MPTAVLEGIRVLELGNCMARIGSPLHLSDTPPVVRRAAPLLGEHAREVLAQAGIPVADIDALLATTP